MKIIFLGTGTSTGVPELNCECEVCQSRNPKDNRLRTSILIEVKGNNILIDCGPDFRQQMINSQTTEIDAVLLTHEHYDHVSGLDDLRPFTKYHSIPIFAEHKNAQKLRQRTPYCFGEITASSFPKLALKEIGLEAFEFQGIRIIPIRVMHGNLPILGYRIGNVAFLTDLTEIPHSEYDKLKNLDILIIGALRRQKHNTHQNIEEALVKIGRINAKRNFLIHASHGIGLHDEISKELLPHTSLSHDGLVIEVND